MLVPVGSRPWNWISGEARRRAAVGRSRLLKKSFTFFSIVHRDGGDALPLLGSYGENVDDYFLEKIGRGVSTVKFMLN